ncbi:hypothetical protein F1728_15175 [Gimesia benthica]|uniref:Type I restriction modification DNA specificity domain-containing protein n=1 Tax=Gimesia benthica TaxID=2608982 RepID=A0A6I6AFS5_9PLAN|nr:restriction endonuclease subunit S [Gimesia benthica]QGQ23941.1 hypothetical protein F1728_15175 [Gimesia benthica]
MSESSVSPKCWDKVRLGDYTTVKARLGWKGLTADEYVDDGYIFLATPNLKGHQIDFFNVNYISKWRYDESPEIQLRLDDVLIVKDGSTLGTSNFVRRLPRPTTVNGSTAVVRTKGGLYPEFLYHLVNGDEFQQLIAEKKAGLGVPHLFQADLREFTISLPPLPQQKKIARILTTVDNLIEKTEALIEKYKAIKQGMMHDLFTRGVDKDGKLRPSYEEVPHLYKESPLGWIPKEWEAGILNDTISQSRPIVYGILMPGYGHQGGIPVIKVKDIKNGEVQLDDLLLTSPEIDSQYKRSKTTAGDLLFTIRGTVGRMAFVPASLDGANITQDTARIGVVCGDARFIRGYLEMPEPQRFIAVHTLGVAVQGINLGDVRRIPIAFPSLEEQKEIGHRVEVFQKQLSLEEANATKLRTLKSGLMQDLLTGKVRVKVDEVEEELTNA